jgi:hypothetical protein
MQNIMFTCLLQLKLFCVRSIYHAVPQERTMCEFFVTNVRIPFKSVSRYFRLLIIVKLKYKEFVF